MVEGEGVWKLLNMTPHCHRPPWRAELILHVAVGAAGSGSRERHSAPWKPDHGRLGPNCEGVVVVIPPPQSRYLRIRADLRLGQE